MSDRICVLLIEDDPKCAGLVREALTDAEAQYPTIPELPFSKSPLHRQPWRARCARCWVRRPRADSEMANHV